jgi:hypothetical protein
MGLLAENGDEMSACAVTTPEMSVGMLIRRPIEEPFEAFVNPDVTTRFWHTEQWPARSGQQPAGRFKVFVSFVIRRVGVHLCER